MRNSKQRDLILNIINDSYSHPSAYDIYDIARKEIDNISLGTVYRNINLLEDQGKVRRIKMNDNIDRFDKTFDNHSHFICIKCYNIIDIDKEFFKEYYYLNGNKVVDVEISFKGICKDCLKEGEE